MGGGPRSRRAALFRRAISAQAEGRPTTETDPLAAALARAASANSKPSGASDAGTDASATGTPSTTTDGQATPPPASPPPASPPTILRIDIPHPGPVPDAHPDDADRPASVHCWVHMPNTPPLPGVISSWRRDTHGLWHARVAYTLSDPAGTVITGWVPATLIERHPAKPPT